MEYQTKAAVIGRKKVAEDKYNCIINLFDINDPHLTKEIPKECLEFEEVDHINIAPFKIGYFLLGNDLIINDLNKFIVEQDGSVLNISGNQE